MLDYFKKIKDIIDNHITTVLGAEKVDWFNLSNPNITEIIELKLVTGVITKDIDELKTILDKCQDTWAKAEDCPVNINILNDAFMLIELSRVFGNIAKDITNLSDVIPIMQFDESGSIRSFNQQDEIPDDKMIINADDICKLKQ